MRLISQQAIAAFTEGVAFSKNNTEVKVTSRPGEVLVELVLHGSPIARRWTTYPQTVEVTTAGWDTPTTRERLNAIDGVSVYRQASTLHLNGSPWHGAWTAIEVRA